ncbi:hypothetical protein RHIZO_02566 [Rhizobiaceae bacterium]|nr:hypothetical protein RHIZO_02566 [Rhizobiaceae bacterium]
MPRLFLCLASLLMLAAAPLQAREQSDAPDAAVIGFSPDGRYFAWEVYGWDIASGALSAAIHVVDRDTNRQADGFPFGVVAGGDGGPALAGGFAADLDALADEPDMDALRADVRAGAKAKLDALAIGAAGRRLAGVSLTQRSPLDKKTTPLVFVVHPTLPSAIPDQQLVYTLEARPSPEPNDCVNAEPPARAKSVEFDVIGSRTWPELKDVARAATTYSWTMPAGDCAAGMWIADVIAPPGGAGGAVAVLFMTASWNSAVDSAAWHGLFVTLPDE